MDLHLPNKIIATKYCFLILGADISFLFFLYLFFASMLSYFAINFDKKFFHENYLFFHVEGCSVFRVVSTLFQFSDGVIANLRK